VAPCAPDPFAIGGGGGGLAASTSDSLRIIPAKRIPGENVKGKKDEEEAKPVGKQLLAAEAPI